MSFFDCVHFMHYADLTHSSLHSRFPTMILMLDFYFLAAVIAAFYVTSLQSLERRNNPNNTDESDRAVAMSLLSPLYIGYVSSDSRLEI